MHKKMVFAAVFSLFAFSFAGEANALNVFSEFGSRVTQDSMKPFAKDLGGLLGSADFHSARTMGFPGFDIGVAGVFQTKPDTGNSILRDSGVDAFGLPIVQAEVGLPKNFGVVLRSLPISDGAPVLGAGLRYSIFRHTAAKLLPDLTVSAFYDTFSNDYMKFRHFSMDIAAGLDLPVLKPYVGLGFDSSRLESKVSNLDVASGDHVSVSEVRYTAGLNVTPWPFAYLFAAVSGSHGQTGFQGGAGVKF